MRRSSLVINGYFRWQRVTGQQRYAHEISNRILERRPETAEIRPLSVSARTRYAAWLDLQARAPIVSRSSLLLSLTGRVPILAPEQIVTIHDLFPMTHPQWFSPAHAALQRRILNYSLKRARGIVVVSEPVRDQVLDRIGDRIPVAVAPNAPALGFKRTANADVLDRVLGTPYLLTVGSLEPRKNLPRLVSAYGKLPSVVRDRLELKIVGGAAQTLRESGLGADLPKGVVLCGRVSDGELSKLYANCEAFVSTSLAEGFGIPVVEAAAAGAKRLILSDVDAYRWVASGTGAIFVDPNDDESIAAGLMSILEAQPDPTLSRLARRFDWESSAAAVMGLVDQVS